MNDIESFRLTSSHSHRSALVPGADPGIYHGGGGGGGGGGGRLGPG